MTSDDAAPKYQPLADGVDDLADNIKELIDKAIDAGFREGVAWSANFLDTLADHPEATEGSRPVYENARDALRLRLLDVPIPTDVEETTDDGR